MYKLCTQKDDVPGNAMEWFGPINSVPLSSAPSHPPTLSSTPPQIPDESATQALSHSLTWLHIPGDRQTQLQEAVNPPQVEGQSNTREKPRIKQGKAPNTSSHLLYLKTKLHTIKIQENRRNRRGRDFSHTSNGGMK